MMQIDHISLVELEIDKITAINKCVTNPLVCVSSHYHPFFLKGDFFIPFTEEQRTPLTHTQHT